MKIKNHLRCVFGLLLFTCFLALPAPVRAGLSLQIEILDEDNGLFTCNPILTLNTNLPDATPVTYHQVYSPHTNMLVGGYGDGHAENRPPFTFANLANEITNGNWTLVVNVGATNQRVFHFTITASNFNSNFFSPVVINFPLDGDTNVPQMPNFQWSGPSSWDAISLFVYNLDFSTTRLAAPAPTVTNSTLPPALPPGDYFFQLVYTLNNTPAVFTASTPRDVSNNPAPGWVSVPARYDIGTQNGFTVVAPPPFVYTNTDPALVAYYSFNDPNNPGTDNSGNGNNLNYTNGWNGGSVGPSTNAIAGGGALQFDNNFQNGGGVLSGNPTPTNLLNALAGSFTVVAWVKTQDSFGSDGDFAFNGEGIVAADSPGLHDDVIPLALVGGGIGFNTGWAGKGDDTLNSSRDINDGNFHQVAVTRDQATGLKLMYTDGVLDSDPNNPDFHTTNLLNDPRLLTIGSIADASQPSPDPGPAGYYDGYGGLLDELQVYSRVLTAGEISTLFQNPGSPLLNVSLTNIDNVVHYTFDDTNDLFHDDSGNGNDIVSESTFGFGYPVPDPAGISQGAVDFNGSNFFNLPTNLLATLAGDFSVSVWAKTIQVSGSDGDQAFQDADILWADANGVTNDSIPMALTGHKLGFFTGNPDTTLHSTSNIDSGGFVFLTVTRRQRTGERKIYINGALNASDTGGTSLLTNSTDLKLGVNFGSFLGFSGTLDDFQMYQGALSDAQVAYLYANPGVTVSNGTPVGIRLFNVFTDGVNLHFSFQSTLGYLHTVQYSDDLSPGSWHDVGTYGGNGGVINVSILIGASSHRYYRINSQVDTGGGGGA